MSAKKSSICLGTIDIKRFRGGAHHKHGDVKHSLCFFDILSLHFKKVNQEVDCTRKSQNKLE